MPSFVEIMTGVSNQLTASIETSRTAFSHNLTAGEAVENAVRKFLRDHLPDNIGVAHGQVIDRHGTISRQLDAVLYDAQRTPILFSDEADENKIIPIEGVIAVVESKTNLQVRDIPDLASSAKLVKSLDRSAYYFSDHPVIETVKHAYGRDWKVLPVMYFVLAFDGPTMTNLSAAIQSACQNQLLHHRIDMACVIQRGIVANSNSEAGEIAALPFPDSLAFVHETKHALLIFYILMSRYVLQAETPPIAIQRYIPAEFTF